jgi:hypothetical protein
MRDAHARRTCETHMRDAHDAARSGAGARVRLSNKHRSISLCRMRDADDAARSGSRRALPEQHGLAQHLSERVMTKSFYWHSIREPTPAAATPAEQPHQRQPRTGSTSQRRLALLGGAARPGVRARTGSTSQRRLALLGGAARPGVRARTSQRDGREPRAGTCARARARGAARRAAASRARARVRFLFRLCFLVCGLARFAGLTTDPEPHCLRRESTII